ncbi:MAG TPA: hypothetical protein VLC48_07860, partial [Gemmatimonadota bacterium]|nr:hypothetical protein [Gemmatimonadota bacterium]
AGSLDSIAATAFNEARRRQIEFRPVLYHLIQFAARQSDVPTAERLLAEYTASEPDSTYVTASRLTVECAASSAHVIDWRTAVETDPLAVHWTAQSLAKAGLRTDCARAGWTALLEHATPGAAGENYRFGALMALHSLLSAEGRREDIESLWAGQTEFADYAGDLLLLAANAGVPLDSRAEAYAGELRAAMPSGELASYEIWMLGVWEQENGRAESVRLLADTLAARFVQSGARLDRLMADVMEARAVLAAGDTMTALDLFRLLAPNKRRSEIWYPWETLAAETVTFARLLHARGQYAEAARVASSLDAPARPAVDLMYLPASLAIRARAARALGDEELERRSRERLANLGRTDLIETLDR